MFLFRINCLDRLLSKVGFVILRISRLFFKGFRKQGRVKYVEFGRQVGVKEYIGFRGLRIEDVFIVRVSSRFGIQGREWLDLYMEVEFVLGDQMIEGLRMYLEGLQVRNFCYRQGWDF